MRECNDACIWEDFGECQGTECDPGETRACYTGDDGTEGVGLCEEGAEACVAGVWSGECDDEVVPETEDCDDGDDNDCDGAADDADPDCGPELSIPGDPCIDEIDCEEPLICLAFPEHPNFRSGYCGDVDCDRDSDCPDDSACVDLWDETYCLIECDDDSQCRGGYGCLALAGAEVCVPTCETSSQCLDADFPICDEERGLCVAFTPGIVDAGAADADAGNGGNGGGNGGSTTTQTADSGCSIAGGSPANNAWMLLAFGVLVGIVRRRM